MGDHRVSPETIAKARDRLRKTIHDAAWKRRVCIVDGFLLFSDDMRDIRNLFDVKMFLRTTYATAKRRREARSGYVTLEGFWEDPPGYVDKVVWPNYVEDHKFLFKGAHVEGDLDDDICRQVGIEGMPREAEEDMGKCLEWAVSIMESVITSSPIHRDGS